MKVGDWVRMLPSEWTMRQNYNGRMGQITSVESYGSANSVFCFIALQGRKFLPLIICYPNSFMVCHGDGKR